MSKTTEFEIPKILIGDAKTIKENECWWKRKKPIVNVKDFEIKFMQLSGFGDVIAVDTDEKRFIRWVKQDDKLKILPLIITSNIYLLAILATLSKTLSTLIKECETDIDNIGINFLVGKGLIEYSDSIKNSFIENYERIIPDFDDNNNNLTTAIEINFSELKSLLNILIVSLEIEGVDLRKIIKGVTHTDLKDYRRETVKPIERIEQTEEWTSKKRDGISDAEGGKRIKEVSLNEQYNITAELLKILMSLLQPRKSTDNESIDKFIFIVATPVKESIKQFFSEKWDELKLDKGRLDDIMFVSYTNPTDYEDPKVIVESIPSYLTIISKYINLQEIVYAIDEYSNSKMIDTAKSRKFQCEKFHEDIEKEIVKELLEDAKKDNTTVDIKRSYIDIKERYIVNKSIALNELRDCIKELEKSVRTAEKISARKNNSQDDLDKMKGAMEQKRENLQKALDEIEIKYIKKQKRELEVINDGFLTVQNDILEQLKLIL
jgi:hypothetical protein